MKATAEPRPLEEIITEEDFLELFKEAIGPLFDLGLAPPADSTKILKRYLYRLMQEANELESLMDDYGARNNKRYSHFTELVASLRGFGSATYSLAHLTSRLHNYVLDESASTLIEEFARELDRTVTYLQGSLRKLQIAIQEESASIGLSGITWETEDALLFSRSTVRRMLPRNIDEEDIHDEKGKIAEVITSFLRAVGVIGKLVRADALEGEELMKFRGIYATEDACRLYEATVHNIQSKYDTYVQSTSVEKQAPSLRILRGHSSVVLHLLECATFLTHFYERHENDIRYESSKERISQIIDKSDVTNTVVNFCLRYGAMVLKSGEESAEKLLADFTDMGSLDLSVPVGVRLHARPCSLIVRVVNHYGTPVEMEMGGERCDASSIMQVMILVGSHCDQSQITFHGDKNTLRDLESLFAAQLGEGEAAVFPSGLHYLTR